MAEQKNNTKRSAIMQFKTFSFKPRLFRPVTQQQIDDTVNPWLKEKCLNGQNPMPGKAFSNHRTGEVVVIMCYTEIIEIPTKPKSVEE
jgi:hypothetical protein